MYIFSVPQLHIKRARGRVYLKDKNYIQFNISFRINGLEKCKTLSIQRGIVLNGDVQLPSGNVIRAIEYAVTQIFGFSTNLTTAEAGES